MSPGGFVERAIDEGKPVGLNRDGDVNGVSAHILPPPSLNENQKSRCFGLFRFAAFGRFLGCLFLGHRASFPRG
jgi:hypothetical protein